MIEKLLNKLLKLFYLGIFLVSMTYLGVGILLSVNENYVLQKFFFIGVDNHEIS